MADSNNPRAYRDYNTQQRTSGADDRPRDDTQRSDDPLAELARLIGQADPFADFERKHRAAAAAAPRVQDRAPEQPARGPRSEGYAPQAAVGQPYPEQDPAQAYAQTTETQYPEQAETQYPEQGYGQPADADRQEQDPDYDHYDESDDDELDEAEYHAQQEQKRRQRRLIAVFAILALAVLGGAGAYGYRAYLGPTVGTAAPPVIRADAGPTKVVPTAQAGDPASNKLIHDRVGETNQAERVVPREERPVDVRTASVTPRPVYSGADANVAPASPSATIAVSGQRTGGHVLPVASEPSIAAQGTGAILPSAKKVRTVTIRPDMTVVPTAGVAATSDPEPPPRAAPPVRNAAPAPPPNLGPPPSAAPARTAPPAAQQRQAAAPLSLAPGGVAAPAPTPRAGSQQPLALAARPPAAAAAGGSVMVQVSSQRSEADAEASFRALQARYPNVLGGRSSVVRRADLGSKGVYYRSMVGPFGTTDQAAQFCASLRAAGGQCIIHRN